MQPHIVYITSISLSNRFSGFFILLRYLQNYSPVQACCQSRIIRISNLVNVWQAWLHGNHIKPDGHVNAWCYRVPAYPQSSTAHKPYFPYLFRPSLTIRSIPHSMIWLLLFRSFVAAHSLASVGILLAMVNLYSRYLRYTEHDEDMYNTS